MPDDRDAPGPAQESLSGTAAHVGNIRVVDRKTKDPAKAKGRPQRYHQPSRRNITTNKELSEEVDMEDRLRLYTFIFLFYLVRQVLALGAAAWGCGC